MNLLIRIVVVCFLVVVSDVYFYRMLNRVFCGTLKQRRWLKIGIVLLLLLFVVFEAGVVVVVGYPEDNYVKYRQLFLLLDAFMLVYLPKALVALVLMGVDVGWLCIKLLKAMMGRKKLGRLPKGVFVGALALYVVFLGITVYGFVYEKTNVKLEKVDVWCDKLPRGFDGFTIVQISDVHLGSFTQTNTIARSVEMINAAKPDMFVCTGDMINVSDEEMAPYIPLMAAIRAPYGKFSILGNHDIGDYFTLKKPKNQEGITKNLIANEQKMGWVVLIDSGCYIHKAGDSMALIGVNNCGSFPFKHSGDVGKAMRGVGAADFKVLLSHDPDLWEKEIVGKTDIALTLSGHTHAMQLAFITQLFQVSPSMFKYKEWYGLYEQGKQQIYVNPGLAYSGFAGRIGTRPEITVITLRAKK